MMTASMQGAFHSASGMLRQETIQMIRERLPVTLT
jgi:hypothetical protein